MSGITRRFADEGEGFVIGSNIITNPTTLTSNSDNLTITGIEEAYLVYLTSSTNVKVYGIDSSLITNTQQFIFVNNNTNGKKIKFENHNNSSSLPQNRFEMSHHVDLRPGDMVAFIYSQVRQRWLTFHYH